MKTDVLLRVGQAEYASAVEFLNTEKRYSADDLTFLELDEWRNVELPAVLAARFTAGAEVWLTKVELVKLMDWKLMKGKFRPTLPKLIKSNGDAVVEEVTKDAFAIFLGSDAKYRDTLKKALNKLCELRGVGPATASLILSLASQVDTKLKIPPFFSDESFLWFNPDYGKIKYTMKEYLEQYVGKVMDVAESTTRDLGKIEQATWAIYKQRQLNPEFRVDPDFLQDYDVYIQRQKAKR